MKDMICVNTDELISTIPIDDYEGTSFKRFEQHSSRFFRLNSYALLHQSNMNLHYTCRMATHAKSNNLAYFVSFVELYEKIKWSYYTIEYIV
jgi:hypothetical protein